MRIFLSVDKPSQNNAALAAKIHAVSFHASASQAVSEHGRSEEWMPPAS